MNELSFNVLRPEQRKFNSNCIEEICVRSQNSLKDSEISRHSNQLKRKNQRAKKSPLNYVSLFINREAGTHFGKEFSKKANIQKKSLNFKLEVYGDKNHIYSSGG